MKQDWKRGFRHMGLKENIIQYLIEYASKNQQKGQYLLTLNL